MNDDLVSATPVIGNLSRHITCYGQVFFVRPPRSGVSRAHAASRYAARPVLGPGHPRPRIRRGMPSPK